MFLQLYDQDGSTSKV